MTDPHTELAALVADLREVLRDHHLRGKRGERPAPGGDGDRSAVPADAADEPVAGQWTELAQDARASAEERLETGAEGMRRVREDLGDCRRCNLCTGRTNIVFGVGDPEADLVVVGEAPGFHEDRTGEPFVGAAGEMLDKMLLHVLGLKREQVYIANIVKCRPPKNRNPLPDEIGACIPFLERQIRALQPKVVLVLGTVAFKALLGTSQGIMRNRGIWKDYQGIPTMPTFHPAYLLRQAKDKRKTFEDLKALRARYDALGGRR